VPLLPPERRLTLRQAVELGLRVNPQADVARYSVESAHGNLVSQRAPINPTLNYAGINNTVAPFAPSNAANYSVAATIETSGRIFHRTDEARAQLHQAEADAETTRLTLRQTVEDAYVNVQVADASYRNEADTYQTAAHLADLTQKQFEAGAAPEANAIRARIALAQEGQNLLRATAAVRTAQAALAVALGDRPDNPVDAVDPLSFDPTGDRAGLPRSGAAGAPTDVSALAERRSEVRSGNDNVSALQAALRLQRSQYYPDLIVGRDLQSSRVQVGLLIPLGDFGNIRGGVEKARADIKTQEAQNQATRLSVRLDIENAMLGLDRAERLVESFRAGILPQSESLLHRVEQGYALGASTILDLIDAQNTLRSTRNDYESALGDYHHALAQAERSLNVPLTATPLGSNPGSPIPIITPPAPKASGTTP
jgi:cobalt-zinc-cadmium efflux system outer membrane protein